MTARINRRELIALAGAAWPIAARAQQRERRRRIGLLLGLSADDPELKSRFGAFTQGLERLGWSEGQNIIMDYRFAPAKSPEEAELPANELVALQPDLIFAESTPVITAVQRATRTIPIVFVEASDPIGSGFIASLAHPGGNLTGLLLIEATITGKWMAIAQGDCSAGDARRTHGRSQDFALRLLRTGRCCHCTSTVNERLADADRVCRRHRTSHRLPFPRGRRGPDVASEHCNDNGCQSRPDCRACQSAPNTRCILGSLLRRCRGPRFIWTASPRYVAAGCGLC
jgi:hypothetical protein